MYHIHIPFLYDDYDDDDDNDTKPQTDSIENQIPRFIV